MQQLLVILVIAQLFTFYNVEIDSTKILKGEYIYRSQKITRTIIRVMIVAFMAILLHVFVSIQPCWLTIAIMWSYFALTFNLWLNKELCRPLLSLGSNSWWDALEKKSPLVFVILKALILVILCTYKIAFV
jgi:hypothetical protein